MSRNTVTLLAASAAVIGLGGVCPAQSAKENNPLLPPDAKPGSCYTRVFVEPTYRTETQRVPLRNAYDKIAVTPARYGMEEKRVMVTEETTRLEVVPAVYGYKEEKVLVKEAGKRLVQVPAEWETRTEKVLEHPAYTVWKRGKGLIQQVSNSTGEIMCLVEVPAKYKTVSTRVLVRPATTKEEEIPAEYTTVRRRVIVTPPSSRSVVIPARYETIRVRTLVQPEEANSIHVPEEFQTVEKRSKVSDGFLEWRSVLCQTNTTPQVLGELQTKLKDGGFYGGPIDGIIGSGTLEALASYQKAKSLPRGGLTIETLTRLGVRLN